MTQNSRISIVMPTHNVQTFVGEAVDSIRAQTFSPFELIIVDDGSTDGTVEILRDVEAAWSGTVAPFRLILQENAGAAAARNRGAAEARGNLLAFIDADDRWQSDTLERLVNTLDAHPESDIACPRYRRINEDGVEVNYLGEPVGAPHNSPSDAFRVFDAGQTLIATPAESATGVLLRREAFETVGGFDPSLMSNNDVDCWLRILWSRQSTLVQSMAAVVDYRMRSDQITSNVERMREGHRRFLQNHRPLLNNVGVWTRMRHYGLVRAYWALLSARQSDVGQAFRYLLSAIIYSPGLARPGTLGSSAAFAIAKAMLPARLWTRISGLRRRLRS